MVRLFQKGKDMNLLSMKVANFMRVEALEVQADGNHVLISGPNGVGKTSAVDALWWGLSSSDAAIADPVRHGADKASVTIDLGEYTVERTKAKDGPVKLTVRAKEGNRISSPQTLLDSLISKHSLDPVKFLDRRPQDQLADVLAVCGVAPPTAKVKEITGEAVNAREGESAAEYLERVSGDGVGIFYGRRRDLTRDLDQKRAALAEQRAALDRLGGSVNGQKVVSVADLARELDELTKSAAERERLLFEASNAKSERCRGEKTLAELETQLVAKDQEIEIVENRLAELRAKRKEHAARIEKGKGIVSELIEDESAAFTAVESVPDQSAKIADIRKKIQTAEADNATIQKRLAATEALDKLKGDVKAAESSHKMADDVLASLRDLRKNILQGVDLGVPGLEVGAGELLLDGVSFKQASTAQRIRVACAVAMRQGPQLKLLRVDEGERLDRVSREALFAAAEANGWRIVMTSVADTEGLMVEIVEGAAK